MYVDGFVLPVPKKDVKAYIKLAKLAKKIWLEHGATTYVECMADDVKPGKYTSFPQSVKLKKNEVVFFSWVTYKSKAQRNKTMKKVMSDERIMKAMEKDGMPFDGKRMFWGGFKAKVQ